MAISKTEKSPDVATADLPNVESTIEEKKAPANKAKKTTV